MSIRDEIRAAIADGKPFCAGGILARVPGCENDRAKLSQNLSALKTEGKIRRAGIVDDEAGYMLDFWPLSAEGTTLRAAKGKGAPKTKSQRTAAKSQRKTAVSVPVRVEPDDNHVVALQADGSVFLLDKSDGTYQSLPPGVVRQILQLSSLRAG
jgi:hypothetical protein